MISISFRQIWVLCQPVSDCLRLLNCLYRKQSETYSAKWDCGLKQGILRFQTQDSRGGSSSVWLGVLSLTKSTSTVEPLFKGHPDKIPTPLGRLQLNANLTINKRPHFSKKGFPLY